MYLSRVELNPYRRETMNALQSPQIIHAAVMASFDSFAEPYKEDGRVLWRIDRLGPATHLLVQSPMKPDMHHIVDQYGRPDAGQSWDTCDYSPFLDRIEAGQHWRFRLIANPVHSRSTGEMGTRGKVCHHITVQQQLNWLSDRCEGLGFSIIDDQGNTTASVVQRDLKKFKRGPRTVTISMVTFEGMLRVDDPSRLVEAMKNGIGRAKAYGCGMLTIVRP